MKRINLMQAFFKPGKKLTMKLKKSILCFRGRNYNSRYQKQQLALLGNNIS